MSAKSLFGGILDLAPVPYVGRSQTSGGGLSGFLAALGRADKTDQLQAMGSAGTLFAVVNKTSTTTASVNWRLWTKSPTGNKEDRKEVLAHGALSVLNRPNRFFTRQELFESVQQHVDLTGEGWLVYERMDGFPSPIGIWYVRPDRIAPVADTDEFLKGYVYTSPDGEKVPLELNEVSQIRMPDPENPYRGLGPVQSIMRDINSVKYSAEWNAMFFANSAEPGGVVEIPIHLNDNEWKEMQERWQENHRGVRNAHRVAMLEHGAKWVPKGYSQRDMQFVELSRLSDDKIREAFGFPKFAQGIVEDVNRATAEASADWFASTLTVPRCDRWKGMLNNDFLPLFFPEGMLPSKIPYEFDYDSPVTPSVEVENETLAAKTEAWARLVTAGANPDDAAQIVGLPPIRMREVAAA